MNQPPPLALPVQTYGDELAALALACAAIVLGIVYAMRRR